MIPLHHVTPAKYLNRDNSRNDASDEEADEEADEEDGKGKATFLILPSIFLRIIPKLV